MATIKSYTDIEQSRKLVDILPIESADMYYSSVPVREWKDKTNISKGTQVVFKDEIFAIENLPNHEIGEGDVYAWSLTALLNVLPNGIVMNKDSQTGRYHFSSTHAGTYVTTGNPIDAAYELILKLNKLNLL